MSALLTAIKADEDFTRWLYYSTQYNHGIDRAARDFIDKCNWHKRHPIGTVTRLKNVKAIIPEFIRTYE